MRSHILFNIMAMTLVLYVNNALGQPELSWSRSYGGQQTDLCQTVIQTTDGGFVLTGGTGSFTYGDSLDYLLIKTDSDGELAWSNTYATERVNYCLASIQTSSGGFALAGYTESDGEFSADFWLVVTDDNGEELWSHSYNNQVADACQTIIQTDDDGFALAGIAQSFGDDASVDIWLVRTDDEGDELWTQTYHKNIVNVCSSIIQTTDGGFLLAGITSTTFEIGIENFWLIKTDSLGELIWENEYGGEGSDFCNAAIQTSDGGYILAGFTDSFGNGRDDFWLVRTDEEGDSLWSRTYGGEGDEICFSVIETPDRGFSLAGYTNSFGNGGLDFWLVRTNEDGEELWSETYGGEGDEACYTAIQTADNGYALAGFIGSFEDGAIDFLLVKTEPDPVSVPEIVNPTLPNNFKLLQPYPNPFNSTTTITYHLPIATQVSIGLFDLSGSRISTIIDGQKAAGIHNVILNANELATGMYFIHAKASGWNQTQKIMLIR